MIKTKIIGTIGPASGNPETLRRLVEAGMNVCRLNFSHGTHQEHAELIRMIRGVAADLDAPIAILQDLSGPKIRTTGMAAGSVLLRAGGRLVLTSRDVPGDENEVGLTYKDLPRSVRPGDVIMLADGAMQLTVESATETDINCRVTVGGELGSHKGINLPGRTLNAPILAEKDRTDLLFGLAQGVDFVALSFVRTAHDVASAKEIIAAEGRDTPLIAKIEKFEALANIDEILAEADGIMVARGDLGVEIPLEQVPRAQKMLIAKANAASKPVITATQMLKSMVDSPRPTRAEVTDVANAIHDGTDAIMLSEETATGLYPVEAVQVMARVAADTEQQLDHDGWMRRFDPAAKLTFGGAVAHAAVAMADDIRAAVIITCTRSGGTTRRVARYRPRQRVLAMTPDRNTALRMALIFGAIPILIDSVETAEELEKLAVNKALQCGYVQPGQPVVLTAGLPFSRKCPTNMLKVITAEWT